MSGLSGMYWSAPGGRRSTKRPSPGERTLASSVQKRKRTGAQHQPATAQLIRQPTTRLPTTETAPATKGTETAGTKSGSWFSGAAVQSRASSRPETSRGQAKAGAWFSGRAPEKASGVSPTSQPPSEPSSPRARLRWGKVRRTLTPVLRIADYAKNSHRPQTPRAPGADLDLQRITSDNSLDTAWKVALTGAAAQMKVKNAVAVVVVIAVLGPLLFMLLTHLVHCVHVVSAATQLALSHSEPFSISDSLALLFIATVLCGITLLCYFQAGIRRGIAGMYLHRVYYPTLKRTASQLREFAKSPVAYDKRAQPFRSMRGSIPFRAKSDPSHFCDTDPAGNDPQVSRQFLPDKAERLGEEIIKLHGDWGLFGRVPLVARRGGLFNSTADSILAAPIDRLVAGVNVVFESESCVTEAGMDSGGLTTEWFNLLCKELTEEDSFSGVRSELKRANSVPGSSAAMFKALPDSTLMLTGAGRLPMYYYALGRMVAMAVIFNCRGENCVMDISLGSALRKFIVDKEIIANDVRVLDPIYFKNRIESLLKPDGVEMMKMILCEDDLFFVYTSAEGEDGPELVPGGSSVKVTEDNKHQYVALLSEMYLCGQTRDEISNFLHGFWDLIPLEVLQKCEIDERDLALLISGIPEIDVAEWREHTEVSAGEHLQVVQWLWEVLEELPMEDRAKVLQFATGLSRVPSNGFAGLNPGFKVHVISGRAPNSLPTAHTCFNTLELAPHDSKEVLHRALGISITEGLTGFELL